MTNNHKLRDGMIHNAVESRRADDTKIMQKVNAVNREAFIEKFPGQLEHTMRLVSERLLNILNKPEGTDLMQPKTWPGNPGEIAAMAQALLNLDLIHQRWHKTDL